MSTNRPSLSQRDRDYANRIAGLAADNLATFNAAMAGLLIELRRHEKRGDDNQARIAVIAGLATLETAAAAATLEASTKAVASLASFYRVELPQGSKEPATRRQHALLVSQVGAWGSQLIERAEIISGETGLSLAGALNAEVTRSGINTLRRAFDTAAVASIHREVIAAGRGIFSLKVAVPVLDRETTDLCRNRMAYQVRAWDDWFVDPRSGARWLFPPFVGAGLARREAWHPCRTIVVPRR